MASTPRKTTPGPKPDFQVVEHSLHCQTVEGEIVLDLRLPIGKLELLMDMGELEMEDKKIPRWLLDNVMAAEDKATLEGMRDGGKAYAILMRYAAAASERLGASLGESQGSTDSSESTEQPSEPTSEPATA